MTDNLYLRAVSVPIPARTQSYSPISHASLIDSITRVLEEQKLVTTKRDIYLNQDGKKLVGYNHVIREYINDNDELTMMIGYKNSYDKSMSVGLAAGANVIVCGNGIVSGSLLQFRRKHTGSAPEELQNKIIEAITLMKSGFNTIKVEVDLMKKYDLTRKEKAELLGVMYFEEELMTPTQLSIIKKELETSEHFRGNTLWDLYNNVTQSLKTSHPLHHIEGHIRLHRFMSGLIGTEVEVNEDFNEESLVEGE